MTSERARLLGGDSATATPPTRTYTHSHDPDHAGHAHAHAHPAERTWLARFIETAWGGVKQNALPGLLLQVIALALVVGYYTLDEVHRQFDKVAAVKAKNGYLFSAISTMIFGGMIPWMILSTREVLRDKRRGTTTNWQLILANGLFFSIFFVERGIEVDAFYQFQGWLWGDDNRPTTIVKKVLFDQFVYSTLLAAPINMLCFFWKDCHFSFQRLGAELDWSFFTFRLPCGLVSNWMVWIPAVSFVYLLPGSLQVPLFNLVLCFYVLLLAFISENAGEPKPVPQEIV